MLDFDLQAVIDDFLPLCRAYVEGRYAVSIGGSLGRGTADRRSDVDFRLFCDQLLPDTDARACAKENIDAAVRRWAERGVIVDGVWVRNIGEIDAQIERWRQGEIAPDPFVWTVWGYHVLTDIHRQTIVEDPFGVIVHWKQTLEHYPPLLKQALLQKHLGSVRYWRGDYHYVHKVERQDVVFAAGITVKIVHDLMQILFALNETYYVGDGYNLDVVGQLALAPDGFAVKVEQALYPRQTETMLHDQRAILVALIDEVEALVQAQGVLG